MSVLRVSLTHYILALVSLSGGLRSQATCVSSVVFWMTLRMSSLVSPDESESSMGRDYVFMRILDLEFIGQID
jgi:hypothetical protein